MNALDLLEKHEQSAYDLDKQQPEIDTDLDENYIRPIQEKERDTGILIMDTLLLDQRRIEEIFTNHEVLQVALSNKAVMEKVTSALKEMSSIAEMDESMVQEQDKKDENTDEEITTKEDDSKADINYKTTASGSSQPAKPSPPPCKETPITKQDEQIADLLVLSPEVIEKIKAVFKYVNKCDNYKDYIDMKNKYKNNEIQLGNWKHILKSFFSNANELAEFATDYAAKHNSYFSFTDFEIVLFLYSMPEPGLFVMNRHDYDLRLYESIFNKQIIQIDNFFKYLIKSSH